MVALVHVDVIRRLDAVADVAPVAVADLDLHIAHHWARDPGHHALEHILVIELAGRTPFAHGREAHDLDGAPGADEFAVGYCRVRIGHCGFDEAVRADRNKELARLGLFVLRLRLTLRVHGPGVVAHGHRRCPLFADNREARATADARV